MANTITMKAAVGFTGTVVMGRSTPPSSGQTYVPDANGVVLVDPLDVGAMQAAGFIVVESAQQAIATPDNGTTQTLTPAMISAAGGQDVYHVSIGGTTPSLTLPLAADLAAALPGMKIGDNFKLRVINSNSGTGTIVTNTGWTLTGTLTLATNTWREFIVTKTAAATFTAVQVGTGANS